MTRLVPILALSLWPALLHAVPVRVAILTFDGRSSGGAELADAVELELELAEGVVLVPRREVESQLKRGRDRLAAESVAAALRASGTDVALVGLGRSSRDGPSIEILAYDRKGQQVVREVFTLTSDEPDADTLAPLIAESLREAVAGGLRAVRRREEPATTTPSPDRGDDDLFVDDAELGRSPASTARDSSRADQGSSGRRVIDDVEAEEASARGGRAVISGGSEPEAGSAGAGWGDRYRGAEGADSRRLDDTEAEERGGRSGQGDRRGSARDDERAPASDSDRHRDGERGSRRRLLDDEEDWDSRVIEPVREETPRPKVGDIDAGTGGGERSGARALIPYVAASLAFDPLYWNYAVEAAAGRSRVDWTPLSPLAGGSLRLEVWPIPYAGVDAQARLGKVQVDLAGIPGLNEKAIEIYLYEAQLHLRGQYVLETGWPGFAAGVRVGYRFLMADAAPQSPFTVVPGTSAHMVAPGLDLRLPFHPQYAVLMASAEIIPYALYAEAPDQPGAAGSATVFGWRADALFRSTIAYGAFIEVRLFWEEFYVTYTGAGDRTDAGGTAFADGKVTTGLRGLSLGAGWSY